jgi:hypothetical protein
MPQYVIKAVHLSHECPTANGKTRQLMMKSMSELPQTAQRLNVKLTVGPLVMGAEHEIIAVVEADRYESVQDFVSQSGMVQWNTVKISGAMSLKEAVQSIEKIPPPLY